MSSSRTFPSLPITIKNDACVQLVSSSHSGSYPTWSRDHFHQGKLHCNDKDCTAAHACQALAAVSSSIHQRIIQLVLRAYILYTDLFRALVSLALVAMKSLFFLSGSLFSVAFALVLPRQDAVTPLSTAQIDAFTPYTHFAAAAYCSPNTTINWSCGGSDVTILS